MQTSKSSKSSETGSRDRGGYSSKCRIKGFWKSSFTKIDVKPVSERSGREGEGKADADRKGQGEGKCEKSKVTVNKENDDELNDKEKERKEMINKKETILNSNEGEVQYNQIAESTDDELEKVLTVDSESGWSDDDDDEATQPALPSFTAWKTVEVQVENVNQGLSTDSNLISGVKTCSISNSLTGPKSDGAFKDVFNPKAAIISVPYSNNKASLKKSDSEFISEHESDLNANTIEGIGFDSNSKDGFKYPTKSAVGINSDLNSNAISRQDLNPGGGNTPSTSELETGNSEVLIPKPNFSQSRRGGMFASNHNLGEGEFLK